LAFNEVGTLFTTINKILQFTDEETCKIVISTSHLASPHTINAAEQISAASERVKLHFQKKPFVAAAVLEVVQDLKSDYVIYMSADMETPPEAVPRLISKISSDSNLDVVLCSRWIEGGGFSNYGARKKLISYFAQQLCRLLYKWDVHEYTYGFRIYKTDILKNLSYQEKKHPFFLESLLVPLKLGYRVAEIPVHWEARTEGDSVATFQTWLSYLRPIFRLTFISKRRLEAK
jgi:glycosyltransferase involved in cell wall biosynthesis